MRDRTIYVISDLHLGGAPGTGTARGFRMTTRAGELAAFIEWLTRSHEASSAELVINGDFLDFLAESHPVTEKRPSPWRSFLPDVATVTSTMTTILGRYPDVVTALRSLTAARHHLTILLGNHDVELSFPDVRRAFASLIGVDEGHGLRFICDGEAYVLGSVLIEHGNRYDGFNAVDFDSLREVRSLQSRGLTDERVSFPAPPGSELVATVMNPLKRDYPFVDLLKPETSAVAPLLLALAPRYRSLIRQLGPLWLRSRQYTPRQGADLRDTRYVARSDAGDPRPWVDIEAVAEAASRRDEAATVALDEVEALLAEELTLQDQPDGQNARTTQEIASTDRWRHASGFLQLLLANDRKAIGTRIGALRKALTALSADRTWQRDEETATEYRAAAEALARGPVEHVIFGHTHLAKDVDLGGGRRYLNTGTWADLARFPLSLLDASDDQFEREIRIFLATVVDTTAENIAALLPDNVAPEEVDRVRKQWLVWEPHVVVFSIQNGSATKPQLLGIGDLMARTTQVV